MIFSALYVVPKRAYFRNLNNGLAVVQNNILTAINIFVGVALIITVAMTTKAAYIESMDPNIILSGDIIGMQVDALGLMCTPAASEPIPEKEEYVSHLRISSSHKKSSTADYRRCMFKIENDSGEVSCDILFVYNSVEDVCASYIKLSTLLLIHRERTLYSAPLLNYRTILLDLLWLGAHGKIKATKIRL